MTGTDGDDSTPTDAPTGPEHPRGPAGPDAPAPPGGPQRADTPAGAGTPGGTAEPAQHPPAPVHARRDTGRDAGTAPEPTADGEIHARTQTEQVNEELQEENAETALDQPSDGSGGE